MKRINLGNTWQEWALTTKETLCLFAVVQLLPTAGSNSQTAVHWVSVVNYWCNPREGYMDDVKHSAWQKLPSACVRPLPTSGCITDKQTDETRTFRIRADAQLNQSTQYLPRKDMAMNSEIYSSNQFNCSSHSDSETSCKSDSLVAIHLLTAEDDGRPKFHNQVGKYEEI